MVGQISTHCVESVISNSLWFLLQDFQFLGNFSWIIPLMFLLFSTVFLFLSCTVESQTCTPLPKKYDIKSLAKASPIILVAKVKKVIDKQGKGSKIKYNATVTIDTVFPLKNGGLSKKNKISVGPFGKKDGCIAVKKGKKALFFLKETSEPGFFWITTNPILRKYKKDKRTLKKFLIIFKKNKVNQDAKFTKKMKLKCKPQKKQAPYTFTWKFQDKDLKNREQDLKIGVKSNSKSSTFTVKSASTNNSGKYVCIAFSKKLNLSASLTFTVDVQPDKHANCVRKCGEDINGFCFHGGMCCQDPGSQPRCLCNSGYSGQRCEHRADYRKPEPTGKEYRHQQRLIAVMGLCLALIAVMIICFSVYCLFKKKRSKVQHMLLKAYSNGPSRHANVESYERPSVAQPLMSDFPPDGSEGHYGEDTFPAEANNSNNVADDNGQTQASDVSSTAAVLDEPHSPCVLSTRPSVSSFNGKRDRLPGLSKSGPHRTASGRLNSRSSSNQLSHASRALENDSFGNSLEPRGSKSSLPHHQPQFPLDRGLGSIVKHQPDSVLSNSVSNLLDYVDGPVRVSPPSQQPLLMNSTSPTGSFGSSKNHKVTTFDPQGNIQLEHLGRTESPLSAVIPHSPVSSTENYPTSSEHTEPFARNSLGLSPNGQLSPADDFAKHNERSADHSAHDQYYNHQYSPSCDYYQDACSESRTPTDTEDPFNGVEIPDTSLGLYNASMQQKTLGSCLEKSQDSETFYFSEPSMAAQNGNISIASAQVRQLPLLTNQVHDKLNEPGSTLSLTSESMSCQSTDDDESPSINV